MFTVFAFVFLAVFETIDNDAMAFFVGSLGGGVVSGYEPFFTWALFYVGAGFLLVLTSYDERRTGNENHCRWSFGYHGVY